MAYRWCTPSTGTHCGEDTSVQYHWCTPRLLQLNHLWSTNVYNMCSATYTPSTGTHCGEDTSVQYRWCTPRLLQLNHIWSTNVYNIEAAMRANFIGSSRSPAAKTITCWTTPTYSSLAANPTADSLQVGYPDSTPDYVSDLSSARNSRTRMSFWWRLVHSGSTIE